MKAPSAKSPPKAGSERTSPRNPSRRLFLKALGAGLIISAVESTTFAQQGPTQFAPRGRGRGGGGPVNIAARIHIGQDGSITVLTGKVECGQGARAEITQAAAEELRVAPQSIQLIMADTSLTPDDGGTFGSQTTPRTIPVIRQAAAGARQVLVALAATKWSVDAKTIVAINGKVVHAPSGRQLLYSELAGGDSAKVFATTPPRIAVTSVDQWKVLGSPVMRNDARDLVTGTHQYPTDIDRPGMLYGKILRPPSYGAKLTAIDLTEAKAIPDIVVVHDGDFVGVAAPNSHIARKAIAALAKTAKWSETQQISSKDLYAHLLSNAGGIPDPDPSPAAKQTLKQTFNIAYLQHAPMEPRAAVAEFQDGQLTVWTGTQNPFAVRTEVQRALGLNANAVRVIVPDFGGGFGGKHTGETAVEAARLARAAGKPVWHRWTREEEFTWAYFRPAGVILTQAGLDASGSISSWYFVNINSGPSALNTPYNVGAKQEQVCNSDPPLRQGSYRGLAGTANHFARESFMDELAIAAGSDPLTFRLTHLDNPRIIAVLKAVAEKFDFANRWKNKMANVGVGLACGTEKGSYVAACAEIVVDPQQKTYSVRHVCQAFECGKILNPANLLSQVQGAVVMGLGGALREEVLFENGRITNGTFTDYEVPRFADLPELDVLLIDRSDQPPAGAGETPIMAVAPAIANALFHATGTRVRQMPIRWGAATG
jgi:isoquinoline 1-oxidoreductase